MVKNRVPEIESVVVQALAEARKSKGLSYEQLAAMAGVHRTSISSMERGKNHPTLLFCLKLCEAMQVSLRSILPQ